MKIIKVLMNGKQVAGAFTLDHAIQKAKKEAGKNARYVRRGAQWGYTGNYGFAYVNEPEARKIDEENSSNSRYPIVKDYSYHLRSLEGVKLSASVMGDSILRMARDVAKYRKEAVVVVSDASDTKKVVSSFFKDVNEMNTKLLNQRGRLLVIADVSGSMTPTNGRDFIFPAAILKGVIEHGDGTTYFGSLMGYADYKAEAINLGWVEAVNNHLIPTNKGRKVYTDAQLGKFTKVKFSRAYSWDWSKIHFEL